MERSGVGLGAEVPGWLVEAITALARAQAKRMAGYFHHFRDIGEADQVQTGVIGVLDALGRGKYDHRRGPVEGAGGADRLSKPFSTFATIVIKRRLIDLHRGRARRAAQDVAIAICADAAAHDAHGEPAELGDEELAVWLRTIRVTAQRRAGDDPARRRGRRRFTAAQEVACAALMWRRGLSCRGAALELAERPELRAALGMAGDAPSYRWLARTAEVVTRFPQKAATANNRREAGTTGHAGRLLGFVELHRRQCMQNLVQGELRDVPALLRLADIQAKVINLSRSTLDQLIAAKKFPAPARKVGRYRLWRRSDVEVWLKTEPEAAPKGE